MGNGPSALEVDSPVAKTAVSFELNGEAVVVKDASPLLSLNDWLRSQPGLAGTKRMCEEGGCGCCVVAVATGSSSPPLTSGGIDEDSWDCVLPEKAAPIAINSVSKMGFGTDYPTNASTLTVPVPTLCSRGVEHYNSGGTGQVRGGMSC